MEEQYETKRDEYEIKSIEMSRPEPKSRGVPKWWLLRDKVMPPYEEVSKLRQEICGAVSNMQTQQTQREGMVARVINPSPGRYQRKTSPPLSFEQSESAHQGTLEQPGTMHALAYLLLTALAKAGELGNRDFGRSQALYSAKGCRAQGWHINFSEKLKHKGGSSQDEAKCPVSRERLDELKTIRDLPDRQKPLSAFWALEDGCKILLAGPEGEAVEVCMERGDVLLFHGDLVHAGAAYPDSDNLRLHVYLYARGINRPGNATWQVLEFLPTRQVRWYTSQR